MVASLKTVWPSVMVKRGATKLYAKSDGYGIGKAQNCRHMMFADLAFAGDSPATRRGLNH